MQRTVIDFTDMRLGDAEQRKAVGEKVRNACTKVGFFYVKNHGFSSSTTNEAFTQSKIFFEQDSEKKHLKTHWLITTLKWLHLGS